MSLDFGLWTFLQVWAHLLEKCSLIIWKLDKTRHVESCHPNASRNSFYIITYPCISLFNSKIQVDNKIFFLTKKYQSLPTPLLKLFWDNKISIWQPVRLSHDLNYSNLIYSSRIFCSFVVVYIYNGVKETNSEKKSIPYMVWCKR